MLRFKETFVQRETNSAQLNAGVKLYFDSITEAKKHGNLPHNAFVVANQDTTCTIYIWLDSDEESEQPDFILYPNQVIAVNAEEGVQFQTLIIKNTHASSNIAANKIKLRYSTAKVIEDKK